jgi:hypothetical protein
VENEAYLDSYQTKPEFGATFWTADQQVTKPNLSLEPHFGQLINKLPNQT